MSLFIPGNCVCLSGHREQRGFSAPEHRGSAKRALRCLLKSQGLLLSGAHVSETNVDAHCGVYPNCGRRVGRESEGSRVQTRPTMALLAICRAFLELQKTRVFTGIHRREAQTQLSLLIFNLQGSTAPEQFLHTLVFHLNKKLIHVLCFYCQAPRGMETSLLSISSAPAALSTCLKMRPSEILPSGPRTQKLHSAHQRPLPACRLDILM